MAINTLQEIDNKIKDFCENRSAVVNEYSSGDFTTFTSSDHRYPLVWATPTRMRLSAGQISFVLNLVVMDIAYDKNDMVKTLSDLSIIVSEILSWLDDDSDNHYYFAEIASEFQPFYRGVDNACGWQGDVVFNLSFDSETTKIRMK